MKESKFNWRTVVAIVAVLLFGARIVVSFQQRQNQKEQQELFEEISRQQREQRLLEINEKTNKVVNDAVNLNLDETIKSLDSTKDNLETIGKRLDSMKVN